MNTKSRSNLSIIEAVETLSSIADLELDATIGIAEPHELSLAHEKVVYKTMHWLHKDDADETVSIVKETFRVILSYLKHFYRKEYGYVTDPKTIEGIKTIMVLVGEAAKKLDKYTELFHHLHHKSVTELKEYRQLQEFYLSKIARRIDDGLLGKWILGLSLGKQQPFTMPILKGKPPVVTEKKEREETQHFFIDLEMVKKDTEYELFFIRKEDGTRFFSPRLLRNIKLVSDFGDYFGVAKEGDPLVQLNRWLDRVFNLSARNILKAISPKIEGYFHGHHKVKDHEVVEALNKAMMALMLSSHPNNLLRHDPVKSCTQYFFDFQNFLREALHTRTYQKWAAYPPKPDTLASELFIFLQVLGNAIYSSLSGLDDMISIIHILLTEAIEKVSPEHKEQVLLTHMMWNRFAADYAAMEKMLKKHPNGPLMKVLNILEEHEYHYFDPLMQHNIPSKLYGLNLNDQRIENIRFGAPVNQEFINKAVVTEEFKSFLRDSNRPLNENKHLYINLEDRTSWREHARCAALEDLQKNPEVEGALTVVTLAIDTEFYHQLAPYHDVNHAETFIEGFKEHLKGEGSGFYFPSTINQEDLFDFIDKGIEAVHRIFFSSKNVLLREHRLDFIEIFYLFLQLKFIDMVSPNSFSLSCKDGIDIGIPFSAEMFFLLKMMNNPEWNEHDIDFFNCMLYGPSILIRERLLLPERFNRMLNAIKAMENAQHEYGKDNFGKVVQEGFFGLFNKPILESKLFVPK